MALIWLILPKCSEKLKLSSLSYKTLEYFNIPLESWPTLHTSSRNMKLFFPFYTDCQCPCPLSFSCIATCLFRQQWPTWYTAQMSSLSLDICPWDLSIKMVHPAFAQFSPLIKLCWRNLSDLIREEQSEPRVDPSLKLFLRDICIEDDWVWCLWWWSLDTIVG